MRCVVFHHQIARRYSSSKCCPVKRSVQENREKWPGQAAGYGSAREKSGYRIPYRQTASASGRSKRLADGRFLALVCWHPHLQTVTFRWLINEATIFSSVLLPQPEGPVINLNSPARSEKLMLLRIFVSPARYPTFCSWSKGLFSCIAVPFFWFLLKTVYPSQE